MAGAIGTATTRWRYSWWRAWVVAIALAAFVASPASAGRPLTTEDTGTLDPGRAEVELSVDYLRDGGAQSFLLPGGPALNIGLLPRLEGTVATAVVVLDPEDECVRGGFGDTVIRLKYRLLDETARVPAVMAAVTARLPTGDEDRGLGERGVDVQPLAVASKTWGPVTLTINAGYTFVTRDRRLNLVNLNASAEAGITKPWSIVGEVVTELATSHHADDRVVVRAGTIYAMSERVRVDAAAGFGATRTSPDLLLTIGVTITLR